jgi:hypothetical protein
VPLSVHDDPVETPSALVKCTTPVGVDGEGVVSVTVTVHVADWPMCIGFGVQLSTMGGYVAMFVARVAPLKLFQPSGRVYASSKCDAAIAGSIVIVVPPPWSPAMNAGAQSALRPGWPAHDSTC